MIIDAGKTKYIDFDVLALIKEFKNIQAPEREIDCQLVGFKPHYGVDNSYAVISGPDADQKIAFLNQPKNVQV